MIFLESSVQIYTESSSVTQGWVYYNFYGSTDCSEEVTYSTGVPDNVCLSANILAGKVTNRKLTSSFSAFKLVNQNYNNTGEIPPCDFTSHRVNHWLPPDTVTAIRKLL